MALSARGSGSEESAVQFYMKIARRLRGQQVQPPIEICFSSSFSLRKMS